MIPQYLIAKDAEKYIKIFMSKLDGTTVMIMLITLLSLQILWNIIELIVIYNNPVENGDVKSLLIVEIIGSFIFLFLFISLLITKNIWKIKEEAGITL
jgi:hypothetical protein